MRSQWTSLHCSPAKESTPPTTTHSGCVLIPSPPYPPFFYFSYSAPMLQTFHYVYNYRLVTLTMPSWRPWEWCPSWNVFIQRYCSEICIIALLRLTYASLCRKWGKFCFRSLSACVKTSVSCPVLPMSSAAVGVGVGMIRTSGTFPRTHHSSTGCA